MMEAYIEDDIRRELPAADQEVALDFVRYLKDKRLVFRRDSSTYWRNRIYYWVMSGDECVCFIAIRNPDEGQNRWTVWSADMESEQLANAPEDDQIRQLAWKHVDHCGHCGSCGGGRHMMIFGKTFDDVCGCTFRIDNPDQEDLLFLKRMAALQISRIHSKQ